MWVLDSGSTQHLTGDRSKFREMETLTTEKQIQFGNKQYLTAEGVGKVELRCATPEGERVVTLEEVFYVPGAAANLFSVKRATDRGAEVVMSWGTCYIKDKGEVTVQAKEVGGLLVVMESERSVGFLAKGPETAELWHKRFGHAGYKSLAKLAGEKLAEGMKVGPEAFRSEKTTICEPCILEKQTRLPFGDGEREGRKS
jgi:hypothetical protein